jgi:hypothetical protein
MTDRKKPILEPTTQAFIDALAAQGGRPIYELSYATPATSSKMRRREP